MTPEVELFLKRLTSRFERSFERAAGDEGQVREMVALLTALDALRLAGGITDHEFETLTTQVKTLASSRFDDGPFVRSWSRSSGASDSPVEGATGPAVFVAYANAPDGERLIGARTVRVIGAEIYDRAIAVQWRVTDADGFDRDQGQALDDRVTLLDDVGTEYFGAGSGMSGGQWEMFARKRFQPGPPSTASSLVVRVQDETVDIPLPGS